MKIIALLMATFALVGCGGDRKMVGKWETTRMMQGSWGQEVINLKSDHSFEVNDTFAVPGDYGSVTMTGTGQWELVDGELLRMTYTDMKWSADGVSEENKKMLNNEFYQNRDKMLKLENGTAPSRLTWVENGDLQISGSGGAHVYKRVKD